MRKFQAVHVLLIVAGLSGIVVGIGLLCWPTEFEASAGIDLGGSSSLLSEIRAAGGTLLMAGLFILAGAFLPMFTYFSLSLSTLFYLSYGLSRVLSALVDGMPSESLLTAAIAELVIGTLSLFVWYKRYLDRQGKGAV